MRPAICGTAESEIKRARHAQECSREGSPDAASKSLNSGPLQNKVYLICIYPVGESLSTIGWATRTRKMSTRYGKQLVQDSDYRKEWAEKVGLGFQLPASIVQRVQLAAENDSEEAAA